MARNRCFHNMPGRLCPARDGEKELYPPYRLTRSQLLSAGFVGMLLGMVLVWLFFRSIYMMLLCVPIAAAFVRLRAAQNVEEKRRLLQEELKDYLRGITSALRSGYALENAMRQAGQELMTIHGAGAMMVQEAGEMTRRLQLHETPELLWKDFAARSGLPEAGQLAKIIATAKRQGGDYLPVLQAMTDTMQLRLTIHEEVETMITGKKMEYRVMCVLPAGILLYLNFTAPDMMSSLYTTLPGRLIMGAGCALYVGAYLWGNRMLMRGMT